MQFIQFYPKLCLNSNSPLNPLFILNLFTIEKRRYLSLCCSIKCLQILLGNREFNNYFYFLIQLFYRMESHSPETVGRTWCTAVHILELYNTAVHILELYNTAVHILELYNTAVHILELYNTAVDYLKLYNTAVHIIEFTYLYIQLNIQL